MTQKKEFVRSAARPRLQGLRLLLVDHRQSSRRSTQEVLKGEGVELLTASSGDEGVGAVLETLTDGGLPFDVVLMSVSMPGMNGFLATEAIRRRFDHVVLPIIGLKANATLDDRQACLAAGMDDCLSTPIDLDHLVACVIEHVLHDTSERDQEASAAGRQPDLDEHMRNALRRMSGDVAAYLSALESFQQRLAAMPVKLDGLFQKSSDAIRTTVDALAVLRRLKTEALALGVVGLATRLAAAENALLRPHGELSSAAVRADLDAAFRKSVEDIAGVLSKLRTWRSESSCTGD